jgi:hypothetical protein
VRWRWRKLRNEELSALYCWPNVNIVTKSRKMKWAGRVARQSFGEEDCENVTTWNILAYV